MGEIVNLRRAKKRRERERRRGVAKQNRVAATGRARRDAEAVRTTERAERQRRQALLDALHGAAKRANDAASTS